MTGCYPGGMTSTTLLPGEEYSRCHDCKYLVKDMCPYNDESECDGNEDTIEEAFSDRLDKWCINCENDAGCVYKNRVACYLEWN